MQNERIIDIINTIKKIIEESTTPDIKINAIVDIVDSISTDACDLTTEKIKTDKIFLETLRRIYSAYILSMESKEKDIILKSEEKQSSFTSIAGPGAKMAYERVSEIFNSLVLEPGMRVVMVGCGQLPVTAIHFSEKSNVKEIICLDVVESSISEAKKVIEKLCMNNIKFMLQSGSEYDYKACDVVYVANMVTPKAEVISQIIRTAKKRPQLIVREPYSFGKTWADHCEPVLGEALHVRAYGPGSRYLSRDMHLDWKK